MPEEATETAEPLTGGRLTDGVVKIGETVRRPATTRTTFTAMLLTHLETVGFDGAPRYLGTDESNREILSFLPGHVPPRWRTYADEQVKQAGDLMRRLHDATRHLAEQVGGGPVICHHDPGPNNVVFLDDWPQAFIDFDMAAPGDPLEDVGYMAWSWCISSNPKRGTADNQARQVRVLADSYGLTAAERTQLLDAVAQRLARNVQFWSERIGSPPRGAGPTPVEVIEWTHREHAFVTQHQAIFRSALE